MSSKITSHGDLHRITMTDIGKARVYLELDAERDVVMLVASDEDRVVEFYIEDQDVSHLANLFLQWLLCRMKRGFFKPKQSRARKK